jgi:hypothetical protein
MGIALRLPHLVLDLLLGHLEVLGVLPLLVDHVQHAQQQQDGDEPQRHVQDHPRDLEHDRQGIQVRQQHDLVAVLPDRGHDHGQDHDGLDDAQARLEQAAEAEDAFEPAERIQLAEPRTQDLRGEEPADLRELDQRGGRHHEQQKRRADAGRGHRHEVDHRLRFVRISGIPQLVAVEHVLDQTLELAEHGEKCHRDQQRAHEQRQRSRQLLAAGDVAVPPGLGPPLRGWVFGALAQVFGHEEISDLKSRIRDQ